MEHGLASLPSATAWYMNPYFMATFGGVVALGFVLFALAYFVFVKLRVGQPDKDKGERCGTCGLDTDMLTRLLPCKDHSGMSSRMTGIEEWIRSHEQDYRELRQLVNAKADRK